MPRRFLGGVQPILHATDLRGGFVCEESLRAKGIPTQAAWPGQLGKIDARKSHPLIRPGTLKITVLPPHLRATAADRTTTEHDVPVAQAADTVPHSAKFLGNPSQKFGVFSPVHADTWQLRADGDQRTKRSLLKPASLIKSTQKPASSAHPEPTHRYPVLQCFTLRTTPTTTPNTLALLV